MSAALSRYPVIRGAAHANAMRADKMRALAARLAVPLAAWVAAVEEGTGPLAADADLERARAALADAREAGVLA